MAVSKSVQNISSSVVNSLINILILVYTSQMLGAEGRGVYTYFISTIALVQLFVAIVGNSTIVYLLNKIGAKPVLVLTTVWSLLISLCSSMLLSVFNVYFADHFWLLFLLLFLQSIFLNLSGYYIYKSDFARLSILKILQPLLLLLLLLIEDLTSPYLLINSLLFSYLPFLIVFILLLWKVLIRDKAVRLNFYTSFITYFKVGALAQFTNIIQFGSYRLTVWLLVIYSSFSDVGVFGLWLAFSEIIWLISVNIAQVNYAKVARGEKSMDLKRVSLLNFSFVVFSCFLFYLVPDSFYSGLLGRDFIPLKDLILLSVLGLSVFSVNKIFSSYFSALGLIKYNTLSSIIGFAVLLISCFPLVKFFGLNGAVISNVLSYITTTFVTVYIYYRVKINKE